MFRRVAAARTATTSGSIHQNPARDSGFSGEVRLRLNIQTLMRWFGTVCMHVSRTAIGFDR